MIRVITVTCLTYPKRNFAAKREIRHEDFKALHDAESVLSKGTVPARTGSKSNAGIRLIRQGSLDH